MASLKRHRQLASSSSPQSTEHKGTVRRGHIWRRPFQTAQPARAPGSRAPARLDAIRSSRSMNRLSPAGPSSIDQGPGMAGRAGVPKSRLQHPQSGFRRRDAGQVRAADGAGAGGGCRRPETEGRAQSAKKASPETEDGAHRAEEARHEIEAETHRAEKRIASEAARDQDSRRELWPVLLQKSKR